MERGTYTKTACLKTWNLCCATLSQLFEPKAIFDDRTKHKKAFVRDEGF